MAAMEGGLETDEGWWLGAIWMALAWLVSLPIITLPVGILMMNRVGGVMTLLRY
jgi:hypothetical protein